MALRWKAWLRPVPLPRLILATVLAWALLVFMIVWWVRTPPFDEQSRTVVSGYVHSVQVTDVATSKPELDLVVTGLPVHLRVASGPFRDYLQAQAPPAVRPGAFVAAKVPREEYQNPVHGAAHQGPTVYVDALTADGNDVLTLAQSRQWDAHNRRYFWRVFVAFAFLAPFVTVLATLRYRLGQAPSDDAA